MTRPLELLGKTVANFTVVERMGTSNLYGAKKISWRCICVCGTESLRTSQAIKRILERGSIKAICRTCAMARQKVRCAEWYKRNRERVLANQKEYRQMSRAHRGAISRKRTLQRHFGISPEQYAERLKAQGGHCAICGKDDPAGRNLAVDHCHTSGFVRGLLCLECNTGLGKFRESEQLLMRAINYLNGSNVVDHKQEINGAGI